MVMLAADVDADKAALMIDPPGAVGRRSPKTKPSWYLVVTEDKMIPTDGRRSMAKCAGSSIVEIKGSHAIYVSQPKPSRKS